MTQIKLYLRGLLIFLGFISFYGCDDNSDEISEIKDRLTLLESAIGKIQEAHDNGKIIKEVTNDAEGNLLLAFTDGTNITVANGKDGQNGANGSNGADGSNGINGADGADGADGITPVVRINDDGYWTVSYDNGKTFEIIKDSQGNPIKATGDEAMHIRVAVTAEGYYAYETYFPSDPATVISRTVTPYKSNPGLVIKSIVRDDSTGIITITMADDTVFRFNLFVSRPTSIVLMTDKIVTGDGTDARIRFRINPSGAFVDFKINGDAPNLRLDNLSRGSRADADPVLVPFGITIVSVEKDTDESGKTLAGQYVAHIKFENAENIISGIKLSLVYSYPDENGVTQYITSNAAEASIGAGVAITEMTINGIKAEIEESGLIKVKLPYTTTNLKNLAVTYSSDAAEVAFPGVATAAEGATQTIDLSVPAILTAKSADGQTKEYTVTPYFSNIPVVFVTTPAPVISKDDWVKGSELHIANAENNNVSLPNVQIKGRGNSTWDMPKKPYAIKLDKKSEILGMPKHKRWCLLANWLDRTLLRNDVAFEVGRRLDNLGWTPRGKFVDLVFNGTMVGNYYLCEQIKVDPNRVNIDKMEATHISDSELTGGYLVELDTYYDEINKFKTDILQLPVNIKDPDEDVLQPQQFDYIKGYFNTIESKLSAESFSLSEIEGLIDIDSFIDWWIAYELVQNYEPSHPKSSYMHKKRNGLLCAGPLWDFDWGTFSVGVYQDLFYLKNSIWYRYLFTNADFVSRVKSRWAAIKPSLQSIPDYIDQIASDIKLSAEANCVQWPINWAVNNDESLSYPQAIERMKQGYIQRFNWIDENIDKL